MGRQRKDGNPLGLEKRVYWHHGQCYYVHGPGNWEPLGTDIAKANDRARVYNDPSRRYGTLGHFIDLYLADAKAGRLLRPKKPRTIADNEIEAEHLKSVFEKVAPTDLARNPSLIAKYRDRRSLKAKVRANRELALLSAVFSWLLEKGACPGLTSNPVLLIARNPETPKERYVEDYEFQRVYGIAQRSVCMAMDLVYRTLQRPADVLALGPQHVRHKTVAGAAVRVISLRQGKTGRAVDIEVTAPIDEALLMLSQDGVIGRQVISDRLFRIVPTLVHGIDGTGYTVTGIGAMVRRYCKTAGVSTFGLMDIRAKGATDMYLAGVPLEKIQVLMGHASVQTTEIYIKRMMQTITIAQPNPVRIA